MTKLSEWLADWMRREEWDQRQAAEEIGVSKTAIQNILSGATKMPKLETIDKLNAKSGVPVWRLVEMCGINPNLPGDPSDIADQIARLVDAQPEYAEVAAALLHLYPEDLKGVRMYLEGLRLVCERDSQ